MEKSENTVPKAMKLFWFCSVLGMFGVHRFAVGKIGTGLLQLFTLGGLFIWWFIDLYKIIRGRFTDKKGNVIVWYAPEKVEGQHSFAGFWVRYAAMAIDSYCLTLASLPAIVVLVMITSDTPQAEEDSLIDLFYYAIGFIYSIYFHASLRQGTLGKRAVGIYVINSDGQRISYLNAFGRYLATIISALTLCIGFFMAGWTKKKRGLHDIIAGTYVVYGKPSDAIVRP